MNIWMNTLQNVITNMIFAFRLNDYIDEHLANFLRKRPNLASAVQESGWREHNGDKVELVG